MNFLHQWRTRTGLDWTGLETGPPTTRVDPIALPVTDWHWADQLCVDQGERGRHDFSEWPVRAPITRIN